MGQCVNCVHWKQNEGLDTGICAVTVADEGKPSRESSLAVAQSSEEGLCYLQTHKQFGCIQFEKRADRVGSFERTSFKL